MTVEIGSSSRVAQQRRNPFVALGDDGEACGGAASADVDEGVQPAPRLLRETEIDQCEIVRLGAVDLGRHVGKGNDHVDVMPTLTFDGAAEQLRQRGRVIDEENA